VTAAANPLTVNLNGSPITVNALALGDAGREMTPAEGQALIQNNVNLGEQIFNAVRLGADLPQPSREHAAALIWYLKIVAERAVNQPFKKGAFTVPDPNGSLHAYLNKVPELYLRSSTHLVEEQSADNIAGGIDFYTGQRHWDLLLPYGLNTVLFQAVFKDQSKVVDHSTHQLRLYVKLEGEGARLNTFNLNPAIPDRTYADPKDVGFKFKDIIRSIRHGTEVFFNTGDFGLSSFRENVPKSVIDAYIAAADHARAQTLATAADADSPWASVLWFLYRDYKPDKGGDSIRIYQIVKNLEAISAFFREAGYAALGTQLDTLLQNIKDAIAAEYDPSTVGDRFGHEAVIQEEHLRRDTRADVTP
jgi:hypothetical protein